MVSNGEAVGGGLSGKCPRVVPGLSLMSIAFAYSVGYTNGVPSEKRFSVIRKILENKGYVLVRISGSHHIFMKPGSLPVSIPVQGGKVKAFYVRKIEKLES